MKTDNNAKATERKRFFHRWNHRSTVHRRVVRLANRVLARVPLKAKYAVMTRRKATELPYSAVRLCDTVVQVGAPFDTLHAGRSRGFHLLLRAGAEGRAFIVEPHPVSVQHYEAASSQFSCPNTTVRQAAVASEPGPVTLRFDPAHPATNFVDGVARYDEEEKQRFETIEVHADRLDDLVDVDGPVRVLSVTTNGAEEIALRGGRNLLSRTEYVALAGPSREAYDDIMSEFGFEFVSFDDRGVTYRSVKSAS